jgi:hypothetical protein
MRTLPRTLTQVTFAAAGAALLLLTSTPSHAQVPRRVGGVEQARSACDAAATRAGYRVMRRDRENINGTAYQLPMHVSHGSSEADVTCSYDTQRGIATLPPWVEPGNQQQRQQRYARTSPERAERQCENYLNEQRAYRVVQVGTPVQHGQRQWDVPVTVRRGRRGDETVTCRYNTQNGKVAIR